MAEKQAGKRSSDEPKPLRLRPSGELPQPVWTAAQLLEGHPEALIQLGDVTYRLRLTAAGKLILTK